MSVTAFGAAKGAPGVTTTVVAVAARWPDHREAVIVEADPSGGSLVARLAPLAGSTSGLSDTPSTVQLAAAARAGVSRRVFLEHLQRLPGRGEVRALVAPPGAAAASTALTALAVSGLGRCLGALVDKDVLIDLGRLDPAASTRPPIGAVRLLLVMRPTLEAVWHTRELAASLRAQRVDLGLVVIGDRPYSPAEASAAVGIEVVGLLPDDPVGALALAGQVVSTRVVNRNRLVRAAGALAEALSPAALPGAAEAAAASVAPRPVVPSR